MVEENKVPNFYVSNRNISPTIAEDFQIKFEAPISIKLGNYCNAFWVKNVPNETSRIDLYFDAGSIYTQPIVASLAASMLLTGNKKFSSKQIHEKLDFYGAYYDVEVTHFHCIVQLYALRENLVNVIRIFIEALFSMGCLANELKLISDEKKQKLSINLERTGIIAQRNFQELIFDGTQLSRLIKTADFKNIKIDQIEKFFKAHFLKGLSRIHVIGAISDTEFNTINELLEPLFAKKRKKIVSNFCNKKVSIHIPKKDALQTAIRIGKICINKKHSDFIGFSILCTILGDYFGSRLMKNIREDKGYTYGIGCIIQELDDTGVFIILTEVGVDQRDLTLQEIKKEINILQNELIPAEELKLVKNYLIGQALKAADGPYAQFDLFVGVDLFNLNLEYYELYLTRLKNISSEELQALALKYLNWDDFSIVTAG